MAGRAAQPRPAAATGRPAVVGLAAAGHRRRQGRRRLQRPRLSLLALQQRRPRDPTARPVHGRHAAPGARGDPVLRAVRLPALPALRGRHRPRPGRAPRLGVPAEPRPAHPPRLLGHPALHRRGAAGGAGPRRALQRPRRLARRAAGHPGQGRPAGPELRPRQPAGRDRAGVVAGHRGRVLPHAPVAGHGGAAAGQAGRDPVGAPVGRPRPSGRPAGLRAPGEAGRSRPGPVERQLRLGGRLALGAGAQLPGQRGPVRLRDGACRRPHRGGRRRAQAAPPLAGRLPGGGHRGRRGRAGAGTAGGGAGRRQVRPADGGLLRPAAGDRRAAQPWPITLGQATVAAGRSAAGGRRPRLLQPLPLARAAHPLAPRARLHLLRDRGLRGQPRARRRGGGQPRLPDLSLRRAAGHVPQAAPGAPG